MKLTPSGPVLGEIQRVRVSLRVRILSPVQTITRYYTGRRHTMSPMELPDRPELSNNGRAGGLDSMSQSPVGSVSKA